MPELQELVGFEYLVIRISVLSDPVLLNSVLFGSVLCISYGGFGSRMRCSEVEPSFGDSWSWIRGSLQLSILH